jgi:hypothetical protein
VRLWSVHPSQLDARGLVALWREGLLARKVLLGATRGYRHHPQLERFRGVAQVDCYLSRVLDEARRRGYAFDASKIRYSKRCSAPRPVTDGQLAYEFRHLRAKLRKRDPSRRLDATRVHPCFRVVAGPLAAWERPSSRSR